MVVYYQFGVQGMHLATMMMMNMTAVVAEMVVPVAEMVVHVTVMVVHVTVMVVHVPVIDWQWSVRILGAVGPGVRPSGIKHKTVVGTGTHVATNDCS